MSQTATYYVPGLTGIIQQVQFNDINSDGLPEILVSDGNKVVLYSPPENIILFETTIDTRMIDQAILFDDFNRDHNPDILIGYYFENGAFDIDTVCRVEIYDGASNYTSAESLYFEAEIDFTIGVQSPLSFVAFNSLDVTADGYNELFVSYDLCRLVPYIGNYMQTTAGQTTLYNSFPGTTDFVRNALFRNIQAVETSTGARSLLGTRYVNLALIPGQNKTAAWVEILSDGGDSLGSIGETAVSLCEGDSAFLTSTVELLCAGNIHPDSDDPDILARYYWRHICYEDDVVSFDESHTSLRLYRIGAPDDIELLWSDLTPEITANFHFLPRYPGFFFSASDGIIRKMSGLNGEEVDISERLDTDTIIWRSGANLTDGDLVAVKNQTLTVYHLGLSTDIRDNENVVATPRHFTLGNPHPNPFNSSCIIEYSVPRRAHTVITVHNLLGQQVAQLVNEIKPAGNHTISWNGKDQSGNAVASGIYFYRMTVDDYTDSKKLVLIK